MGLAATITTSFGEERECYIRLNNIEASNHGIASTALFRAFLSKSAFEDGAIYVKEYTIELTPDLSAALWPQFYTALAAELGVSDVEV